jgi:hypothetical protein
VDLIVLRKAWKRIQTLVHDKNRFRNGNRTTIGYICGDDVKNGGFEDPGVSCS